MVKHGNSISERAKTGEQAEMSKWEINMRIKAVKALAKRLDFSLDFLLDN